MKHCLLPKRITTRTLAALLVLSLGSPTLAEQASSLAEVDQQASNTAWDEAQGQGPGPAKRQPEPEQNQSPAASQGAEQPAKNVTKRRRRRPPQGKRAKRPGDRPGKRQKARPPHKRTRDKASSKRRSAADEKTRRVRRRPPQKGKTRRVRRGDNDSDQRRSRPPQKRRRRPVPEPEPRLPDPAEGSHWTVGARVGFVSVPAGLLHVFVDGGQDHTGVAAGAFFSYQKGLFEVSGNVWWADFRYDDEVIFQTAGDRNDPEFVINDLSSIIINADFLWTHWFNRWLGATYGAGLGIGVMLGEVRRTEATPPTGPYTTIDETPTHGYVHCRYDHEDPQWTTPFCEPMCDAASVAAGTCPPRRSPEDSGDLLGFYDTQEDRIPKVLPWINILVGLRIIPHPNFQIDIQTGIGLGILFTTRLSYRF